MYIEIIVQLLIASLCYVLRKKGIASTRPTAMVQQSEEERGGRYQKKCKNELSHPASLRQHIARNITFAWLEGLISMVARLSVLRKPPTVDAVRAAAIACHVAAVPV